MQGCFESRALFASFERSIKVELRSIDLSREIKRRNDDAYGENEKLLLLKRLELLGMEHGEICLEGHR